KAKYLDLSGSDLYVVTNGDIAITIHMNKPQSAATIKARDKIFATFNFIKFEPQIFSISDLGFQMSIPKTGRVQKQNSTYIIYNKEQKNEFEIARVNISASKSIACDTELDTAFSTNFGWHGYKGSNYNCF